MDSGLRDGAVIHLDLTVDEAKALRRSAEFVALILAPSVRAIPQPPLVAAEELLSLACEAAGVVREQPLAVLWPLS